jgi:serine/threonine protein kinase
VFARKVIRAIGDPFAIASEIENEIRVIQKLHENGGHKNIVSFLNHGWLAIEEQVYYIDMDLCTLNLRDFVNGTFISALGPQFLEPPARSTEFECLCFWIILKQVTEGLKFVHDHGELHRDIKPENSKFTLKFS